MYSYTHGLNHRVLANSLSFGPCRAPSVGVPSGLLVFAAESGRLGEELFHQPLRHRLHLSSSIVPYQNSGVVSAHVTAVGDAKSSQHVYSLQQRFNQSNITDVPPPPKTDL